MKQSSSYSTSTAGSGSKPKPKRIITEARKIQNREAQRAYRQRQKDRQKAQKELHEHRSSNAYQQLRPHPPVVEHFPDQTLNPSPSAASLHGHGAYSVPSSLNFPFQALPIHAGPPVSVNNVSVAASDPLQNVGAATDRSTSIANTISESPFSTPGPGHGGAPTGPGTGVSHLHPSQNQIQTDDFRDLEVDGLFPMPSGSDLNNLDLDYLLDPLDEQLLLSFQEQGNPTPYPPPPALAPVPVPIPAPAIALPSQSAPSPTDASPADSSSPEAEINTTDPDLDPDQSATGGSGSGSGSGSGLANPYSNSLTPLRQFFLAGTMYNANCLRMDADEFFGLDCNSMGSPFYQEVRSSATDPKSLLAAVIASNPFIPVHLRPTLPQILIQHHPLFDLIPMAALRSRAIILSVTMPGMVDMADLKMDIIDGGLVCKGGSGGGSGQPWDLRSWEVSPWFGKKWRLLLDGEGEGGDLWGN